MSENAHKTRTDASTRRAKPTAPALYELEADAIKALAHPKRLLIVDLLSNGSERTVGQLQQETGFSQSNVSQNLAILRTAGLLHARRDGNNVHYSLSDPRILKAVTLLRGVLERQIDDEELARERKAFKAKERAKKTTTYAALVGLGLLAVTILGAGMHPLWTGGTMEDVENHVTLMLDNPMPMGMMETCRDVLIQPRMTTPSETSMVPA